MESNGHLERSRGSSGRRSRPNRRAIPGRRDAGFAADDHRKAYDLEQFFLDYIRAAGITEGPLFRIANHGSRTLTKNAMTGVDICRMMKRRLKAAGAVLAPLVPRLGRHRFAGTECTD